MRWIALLLLASCGFNFDSPSEVKDLRVLGLRADPPQLTATTPITFVQLDALIGGTDPSTLVDYEWTACAVAPTQGGFFGSTASRCPEDAGTTIAVAKGNARADSLQAVLPVPREIVEVLGSGVQGLSLQLQAQLKVNDLYAVKRITVTPTLPAGQQPNANPVIDDLTIADAGCGTDAGVCRYELNPVVDAGSNQKYFARNLNGEDQEQTERMSFAWFATSGTLELGNTQEPDPDLNIGQRLKVSTFWREPRETPAAPVTFWVVVRDGRGGESWTSRQLVFP